jgi:hypothetical protein
MLGLLHVKNYIIYEQHLTNNIFFPFCRMTSQIIYMQCSGYRVAQSLVFGYLQTPVNRRRTDHTMAKTKRTNNDKQNIIHKTKDRVTRTPQTIGYELRCSRRDPLYYGSCSFTSN